MDDLYYVPGDQFELDLPKLPPWSALLRLPDPYSDLRGRYMLARTAPKVLNLIHLTNGNRWTDRPLRLKTPGQYGPVAGSVAKHRFDRQFSLRMQDQEGHDLRRQFIWVKSGPR